jgi:3-oxoacyl-[acyl-carrier protein] reductase
VNEFRAELILKGGDLLAHGRLTDSAFLCDSGEAPFFNYADEHLHRIESVHMNLPILLWNGCHASNTILRLVWPIDRPRYHKRSLLFHRAFLSGIAGIPNYAKSVCGDGTSTYQAVEISKEMNRPEERIGDHMLALTEKVALVTGGSRGIGAAIAKRLAKDGASVAITYSKDASAASAVVNAIEGNGGKAVAIQADAADAEAVKAAVEKTVATFGRLDVLVNNAGTAIPKPFEETTLEEMDRVIDINVRGVFIATQAALKHMKSGGRIISIGSAVGERVAAPGLVPYAGTKGAVKMFTQALAREIGNRGITVNNVQPGPIDTDLNPAAGDWAVPQKAATALDRYGRVDEIAAAVAFVAGPESSYITGSNLTVDGGMNA